MKGYAFIAQQVKKDITLLSMRLYNLEKGKEVFESYPGCRNLFANINLVLRDASADEETLRPIEQKYENLEELLALYLNTSEKKIFQDCLHSARCSKKLNYFLFTHFPKSFGIDRRAAMKDKLHKIERLSSLLRGSLYTHKRELTDLIRSEKVGYAVTKEILNKYLKDLGLLLKSQILAYDRERIMLSTLSALVQKEVIPEWFKKSDVLVRGYRRSYEQLAKILIDREVKLPKTSGQIRQTDLADLQTVIQGHAAILRNKVTVLQDMLVYVNTFVKDPEEIEQEELTV